MFKRYMKMKHNQVMTIDQLQNRFSREYDSLQYVVLGIIIALVMDLITWLVVDIGVLIFFVVLYYALRKGDKQ